MDVLYRLIKETYPNLSSKYETETIFEGEENPLEPIEEVWDKHKSFLSFEKETEYSFTIAELIIFIDNARRAIQESMRRMGK